MKDENGFDKVEMPAYEALLSFPDTVKKTRITLKYKNNNTVIYQVKGEEQVYLNYYMVVSTPPHPSSLLSYLGETVSAK